MGFTSRNIGQANTDARLDGKEKLWHGEVELSVLNYETETCLPSADSCQLHLCFSKYSDRCEKKANGNNHLYVLLWIYCKRSSRGKCLGKADEQQRTTWEEMPKSQLYIHRHFTVSRLFLVGQTEKKSAQWNINSKNSLQTAISPPPPTRMLRRRKMWEWSPSPW